MTRTEIMLTDEEAAAIRRIAGQTARKEEEVIHSAIGLLIGHGAPASTLDRLRMGRGVWRDRVDVPNIRQLRASFDRF